MKTNIPHTVLNQILQTKSFPETIVALLNEAEENHLPVPKHWNAKRIYPYWKACSVCQMPYPTCTKEQATRNKTCSQKCRNKIIGKANTGKKQEKQVCPVCKKEFYPTSQSKNKPRVYCSSKCNGKVRGVKLTANKFDRTGLKFPGTGLKGEKNPAWKGGVTYFRKKGYYCKGVSIKYVRCPEEYSSMARKDGYVAEHRLIMAQSLGRALTRKECVHHINHTPTDNRLENLMLFKNNKEHKLYEAQELR